MSKYEQLKKLPRLSEGDRKILLAYSNAFTETGFKTTLQSSISKNSIKLS
jgi:hypothetical protein